MSNSPPSGSAAATAGLTSRGRSNSSTQQRFAFVTLITTDTYLPGALVLAHSLRQAHSTHGKPAGWLAPADLANLGAAGLSNRVSSNRKVDLICLVTPATVSVRTTKTLVRYFDKVVGVEPLGFSSLAAAKIKDSQNAQNDSQRRQQDKIDLKAARKVRNETRKKLALLGRPDLGEDAGAALTKLHAWRLTGYDKVVYLDADILVLRPLTHLFSISSALAASPDIGWPDSFNTGVMVLTPSLTTFSAMREFAVQRGSWDGADQGLLNDFYGGELGSGEEGTGGGWQRLPFRYNVTPNAGYTFAPAYQRYGAGIMAAHFIGAHKPWHRPKPTLPRSLASATASTPTPTDHETLVYLWHVAFEECYPNVVRLQNGGTASVIHTERGVEVVEQPFSVPTFKAVWDLEGESASSSAGEGTGKRVLGRSRRQRAPSSSSLFRGAGQAEDLKEMFNPAIVAASAVAELEKLAHHRDVKPSEGVYISLPLDARTSLMAAQLDSGDELNSSDSDETFTEHRMPGGYDNSPPVANTGGTSGGPPHSSTSGEWSPPKVSWDPARGPPPTESGIAAYQMRDSIDTFYVNAWDQPLADQPRGKAAFFREDASSNTPGGSKKATKQRTMDRLQREHFFDNLGSAQPDLSKVKPVFPWESSRGGRAGARIFPDEDPASTVPGSQDMTNSLAAGGGGSPATSPIPHEVNADNVEQQPRRGGGGLPDRIAYANAWDSLPSHNRYGRAYPGHDPQPAKGIQAQPSLASRSTQTAASGTQRARGLSRSQGTSTNSNESDVLGSGGGSNEQESLADQSGDGDNESSSSSDEEMVERDGASWRREGPGPGYQRKAVHHQHHNSGGSGSGGGGTSLAASRSPRHGSRMLSSGGTPTVSRTGAASLGVGSNPTSDGLLRPERITRSRSSSGASGNGQQIFVPSAVVNPRLSHQFPDDQLTTHSYDTPLTVPYEQLLGAYGSASRRRMGMRTPTTSQPNSANNSGASSPSATPTILLSPRQSRSDLSTLSRLASTLPSGVGPASSIVRPSSRAMRRSHRQPPGM
jgi:hypothetical protein